MTVHWQNQGEVPPIQRGTHRCPIAGCPYRLPYRTLLCSTHWGMVPPDLKRRVWDTWGNGSPKDHAAYLEARSAAIAAVERKRVGG